MNNTPFSMIMVLSLTTAALRLIPFILFKDTESAPKWIQQLGGKLAPALMGMLVVYCLKGTAILSRPFAIPEITSIALIVFLQWKKGNMLLSISTGTLCYMAFLHIL